MYRAETLPTDVSAANTIAMGEGDRELQRVHEHLLTLDSDGTKFAEVLRNTIDQLLDGENTGRYDWRQLHKTEKTHAGTLVEINLQRRFDFSGGQDMDYAIVGVDVDCKFSQDLGGWMIPPEAMGEICLVVWANDQTSRWSAGLLRADGEKLTRNGLVTRKGNRDHKYRLNKSNLHLVTWLWHMQPLKENLLLHLDDQTRHTLYAPKSGQKRVNELFRHVQRKRIDRNVVRTLAQQHDYMARVRDDRNRTRARPALREEGYIIPGDSRNHQAVAEALGGPVPEKGEFVSFRVGKAQHHHRDRPSVELDGCRWVVLDPNERADGPAPMLPSR
ncbi:NaeI family type II restriction endonuclease [Streptomyces europaeiscabiei]|uniref:NaeI family type II restriction endonuclease n=1 Tax=Streptomyces europaeiscabiei TaxID=146819 RepID=UPI0029BDC0E2|nr:NaeI family type II restriction endonuclease [Streptomyces europaeiscabiei]MDX3831749.1 NaeI family type II restriction endonuclease [Streptomyces europaeiscabiei]